MKPHVWAFLLYTVWWQSLVWGLFGYAVFIKDHSGWWFLLAVFLSAAQYKPERFGLPCASKDEEEDAE